MLRVSFKSWCTCSGLIKTANPRVCTIPEIRRYHATAACTILNSKEACSSWAHTSALPSPFNRLIISVLSREQVGDLLTWFACLCTPDHKKVSQQGLVLCTILGSLISMSANEAVATLSSEEILQGSSSAGSSELTNNPLVRRQNAFSMIEACWDQDLHQLASPSCSSTAPCMALGKSHYPVPKFYICLRGIITLHYWRGAFSGYTY